MCLFPIPFTDRLTGGRKGTTRLKRNEEGPAQRPLEGPPHAPLCIRGGVRGNSKRNQFLNRWIPSRGRVGEDALAVQIQGRPSPPPLPIGLPEQRHAAEER